MKKTCPRCFRHTLWRIKFGPGYAFKCIGMESEMSVDVLSQACESYQHADCDQEDCECSHHKICSQCGEVIEDGDASGCRDYWCPKR